MGDHWGRKTSWMKRIRLLGVALLFGARCRAVFTCDGSATVLDALEVNDDYCHCADGTDETLTPACSHIARSRFACVESGPLNQTVPTSRVWDGVCDCCDGSDEIPREAEAEGRTTLVSRGPEECENRCQGMIEEARAEAIEAYRRVETGLERRRESQEEGSRAIAKWKATLKAPSTDADKEEEKTRKEDRKAVEKLEALLKVYLRDEERLERRERIQLAAEGENRAGDAPSGGGEGARYRRRAAALGPTSCGDEKEEREAAEKVRVMRAAAMARLDEEKEKEKEKRGKKERKRGSQKDADRSKSRPGGRSGGDGGRDKQPDSAEDILDLRWPLANAVGEGEASSSGGQEKEEQRPGGESGGDRVAGMEDGATLSLRSYVKRRQQGDGREPATEEKKREELRKTALLGPVLNDGARGVNLGLTILLRAVGLPLVSPVRGLVEALRFLEGVAAKAVTEAASDVGAPLIVRETLEGYRDRGLEGISPYLDYRRYPTLRSLAIRWDMFLEGSGRFLLVMWDAPVALWEFLSPDLDDQHLRPEAAMLREGIARAKASLRLRDEDRERGATAAGKGAKKGHRKREETEAKRLLGLDLGDDSGFAALAEKCLELREGGYVYSLCPFKDAKQDRNSLGKWKAWSPRRGRNDGRVMVFDGGSRYHNKKQRSAEVRVECGPSDALVAADELEIGVYRLVMETPLACTESDLREAQQRVEVFQVSLSGARERQDEKGEGGLDGILGNGKQEL